MLKKLTEYLEKILALIKPLSASVMSRLRIFKDQVFAMYWDLTPDNRQRVRLVAFAFEYNSLSEYEYLNIGIFYHFLVRLYSLSAV